MADNGTVRVGTSGWRYAGWRGDFYPAGLKQREELSYLAGQLRTVEINGSFYSLQRPTSYRAWREHTGPGFVFAVKGSRYLTHMKRLRDVETGLANFLASGLLELGPSLGPIVWQLPERTAFDPDVLDAFLAGLPRTTGEAAVLAQAHDDKVPRDRAVTSTSGDRPLRHALEVRHRSFDDEAAYAVLEKHEVACVLAQSAGRWPMLDRVTSDFVYVRLHGDQELYASGYSAPALDAWADRCRGWSAAGLDVYVYFDNDARGFAPHDAVALAGRLTPS